MFAKGVITYKKWVLRVREVLDELHGPLCTLPEARLEAALNSADEEEFGTLSGIQLASALHGQGVQLSANEVEKLLAVLDLDGDNRADIEEMLDVVGAYRVHRG